MQWNCPHCGVSLAIPGESLGTGWAFSRCYKCGGFALIRKTEVNVIKVDKAPPGERIILPESSESPTSGLLSEKATQNLVRHSERALAQSLQQKKPILTQPLLNEFPPPLPGIPEKSFQLK